MESTAREIDKETERDTGREKESQWARRERKSVCRSPLNSQKIQCESGKKQQQRQLTKSDMEMETDKLPFYNRAA